MSNTYKTISGDMWDSIAFKALGGERYTDRLIKANLQYRETVIFPAGVVLRLSLIHIFVAGRYCGKAVCPLPAP